MENTSGQGSRTIVPKEVKGWNWGAFCLTWIWGIRNKVWQALTVLIPLAGFILNIAAGIVESHWGLSYKVWQVLSLVMLFIGFIMAIVLGIKGNELAWRKKRWDSIEHFRSSQTSWGKWGIGLLVVLLGLLAAIIIPNILITQKSLYPSQKDPATIELSNVKTGVTAMMLDNNLKTLPNPVGVATNDMGVFPDSASVVGSADKLKDWNGNIYGSGDKNGYLLYGHDMTADNSTTKLENYLASQYTKGTYTVNAMGEVTQVTTGY